LRFPSSQSHCCKLPNRKRRGILVAFSHFSSCRQKKPQWAVEKAAGSTVIRTGGRGATGGAMPGAIMRQPFTNGAFKGNGRAFRGAVACEKAPPTTKTVQKIKKKPFLPNISVALHVNLRCFPPRSSSAKTTFACPDGLPPEGMAGKGGRRAHQQNRNNI
jgi:hypothetical protein